MTDQTTPLRDRIAAALAREDAHNAGYDHGFATSYGADDETDGFVDAVLAVLPAAAEHDTDDVTARTLASLEKVTERARRAEAEVERLRASQAAVLRKAADVAERLMDERYGPDCSYAIGGLDVARELRRMADETATTETQARRGDAFEAWLKAQRDACFGHASSWAAVDGLLDQYRLHADTGTPLGEHVCEGKVVGDCECLEQPAAGARQDGAQ